MKAKLGSQIVEIATKQFYELKKVLNLQLGEMDERLVIKALQNAANFGIRAGIYSTAEMFGITKDDIHGV